MGGIPTPGGRGLFAAHQYAVLAHRPARYTTVGRHGVGYLAGQASLNPYPAERMPGNHG